jgi:hypothetical protein
VVHCFPSEAKGNYKQAAVTQPTHDKGEMRQILAQADHLLADTSQQLYAGGNLTGLSTP